MSKSVIRNPEAVRQAALHCCERREVLILVTPYLRLETSFQKLEGDVLHVAATVDYEDAMYGLKAEGLKMRFPHLYTFLEGNTKFLGFGMVGGRRTLRLALPKAMEEDEQRRGYRVDRVGRVAVTFSTRRYDLLSATLVNLSVGGVRIAVLRDLPEGEVEMDDRLSITIPLSMDIHINTRARVRYIAGRSLGLEFHPPLEGLLLERLSRWVFQRKEEDIERAMNRSLAGDVDPALLERRRHEGIILISSEEALLTRLKEALPGLPEPTRLAPTAQGIKEIDLQSPVLLVFHVPRLGLDERRRMRTLVEPLQGKLPFLLLATGEVDAGALAELGGELKATSVFRMPERPNPLFPRLVQGIMRKHFEEPAES